MKSRSNMYTRKTICNINPDLLITYNISLYIIWSYWSFIYISKLFIGSLLRQLIAWIVVYIKNFFGLNIMSLKGH